MCKCMSELILCKKKDLYTRKHHTARTKTIIFFMNISGLIEMTITQGEDVALNCSFNKSSENKAVWWFKNEILLAEGISPIEVGLDNVMGNLSNGTEPYLYIYGFNSANTGIYNCTVGKGSAAEYNLLLKGKENSYLIKSSSVYELYVMQLGTAKYIRVSPFHSLKHI